MKIPEELRRELPWLSFPAFMLVLSIILSVWLMVATMSTPSPSPSYEYRLVTPAEAMQLVNNEGWRVSERIRMTDAAVYIYHKR